MLTAPMLATLLRSLVLVLRLLASERMDWLREMATLQVGSPKANSKH